MAGAPAGYDVFLSYSWADAAAAETLRARLRDAGLTAFLDRYALPADRPWQPDLEAALAAPSGDRDTLRQLGLEYEQLGAQLAERESAWAALVEAGEE